MTDQPRRLASKTSFAAVLTALSAMGWGGTAAAQSDVTVFAGGKLDVADSAYAGASVGLPGSVDGKGWAVRGSIYTGGYDYQNGPTTIEADFTGARRNWSIGSDQDRPGAASGWAIAMSIPTSAPVTPAIAAMADKAK